MQFAQGYARRRKRIYAVKRCGFSHFFATLGYPFCTNFLQKFIMKKVHLFSCFVVLCWFLNNVSLNQKSETVKLIGYGWTCFHDSSGPRKFILRIPRPYSEAHEKLGFQAFSSAKRQKAAWELENSIFEKLFKMDVGGQNGSLITP